MTLALQPDEVLRDIGYDVYQILSLDQTSDPVLPSITAAVSAL
jgi:hypothetical protein